jgi:hypothetical protein
LEILGYKPTWNLRGFGDYHSGLKKISHSEYNDLVEKFQDSRPIKPPRSEGQGGAGHGHGEGDIHLNLKNYVASNPSTILDEEGLRRWEVEYELPTNDRVDIVLVDAHKRIVGVEIEPAVTESQLAGPLQAIKYWYMLECFTNRERGDSRAMLIAHDIADNIKILCERYGIEWYEVSREDVDSWAKENAV